MQPLLLHWVLVQKYLFIQKQRYGDHLNYVIRCDETLKTIVVPKIILQPIVENAIYHGIKALDEAGMIEIVIRVNEKKLIISVIDNGVGFKPGETNKEGTKLGGVGIENVRKRLKLIYGEISNVTVKSEKAKGTEVMLIIPME